MKILWFYRFTPEYHFDHWLHVDFALWMNVYDACTVKGYGHRMHEEYPDFVVMPWNKEITMKDIKKEYDFDLVLLNTKSRMFERYMPPVNPDNSPHSHSPTWLPKDFAEYDCPKVMLEEDYHWEANDDWYYKQGIDLILQRHYSQTKRGGKVKKVWLPFSVDTSIFAPNPKVVERDPRICYMGGYTVCYIYRNRVKLLLRQFPTNMTRENLLVDFSNHHREERYIKSLQNFRAYLNGSATVNHTAAKMFEIMASGGLLFTNKSDRYGLKQLFPDDTYVAYKEDFSDVITLARKIVKDKDYSDAIAKKGMDYVCEHHNHKVRIGQLMKILNSYIGA